MNGRFINILDYDEEELAPKELNKAFNLLLKDERNAFYISNKNKNQHKLEPQSIPKLPQRMHYVSKYEQWILKLKQTNNR